MPSVRLRLAFPVLLGLTLLRGPSLGAATVPDTQPPLPLRTEEDAQNLCESVLAHIVDGDVAKAIAALRPYATSISREDVDSLQSHLQAQASTIKDNYGDPLGFILISADDLKHTVLKMVYVVKYERHLIRWTFIFYKPFDSWILDYFNYDDAIERLFSGSASTAPAGPARP